MTRTVRVCASLITALSLSAASACSDADESSGAIAAPAAESTASSDPADAAGDATKQPSPITTFDQLIDVVVEGLSTPADIAAAQAEIVAAVEAGPDEETLAFLRDGYRQVPEGIREPLHYAVAQAAYEVTKTPGVISQYAADKIHGYGTEKDLDGAMELLTSPGAGELPGILLQRATVLLDESYGQADREQAVELLRQAADEGVEAARTKLAELGETM